MLNRRELSVLCLFYISFDQVASIRGASDDPNRARIRQALRSVYDVETDIVHVEHTQSKKINKRRLRDMAREKWQQRKQAGRMDGKM